MSQIFGDLFNENDLFNLLRDSKYIPSENDEVDKKVLFDIFNRHLAK